MSPFSEPQRRVEEDALGDPQRRFGEARWAATMHSLLRTVVGQSSTLVPFEAVRARVAPVPVVPRGTQIIPLEAIVGSVERYHDFTREFLPRNEELGARWQRLDRATRRQETIPPIDVYKLGDVYFVRDGNHRVSVARFNGASLIEANVTELPLKVPLTPDMDVNQLILAAERSDFLTRTRLDEVRPDTDIRFTAPGRYYEALEHIAVHRWYLGLERTADVPYAEAVIGWHDNVYTPAVETIRQSGLLANFPRRTAADLYLWTMRHQVELQAEYSQAVDTRMAAANLAREHTDHPVKKVVQAVKKKVQGVLPGEDVPPIIEDLLDKLEEQERAAGETGNLTTPDSERQ
jgi:hypothetical protein